MTDYYLRFSDKTQAYSILSNYVREGVLCGDKSFSIDEIGVLYNFTYDITSDGLMTNVVKTATPGYHVNIRTRLNTDYLDNYKIYPNTPSRQWA